MHERTRSSLVRCFEWHLRAEDRSERTIAAHLIGLRQADAFLRVWGTTLEAATRTWRRSWPISSGSCASTLSARRGLAGPTRPGCGPPEAGVWGAGASDRRRPNLALRVARSAAR
jgi:hypothetical protein